jgi:hypothetical protein
MFVRIVGWGAGARRTVAEGVVGAVGLTRFGHCERLVSPKAW